MSNAVTKQETDRALLTITAVAEAIRELGSVPSGHLYAHLSGKLDLRTYEAIVGILTRAGLVRSNNHLLTWVG